MTLRLFLVLSLVGCGASSSERNTLDSIPKAAAAALRTEAHGAEITEVSRESEHGQELYEGTWREGGLRREAKVTADGKVVEVEREVAAAAVPEPVRVAASQALPAGAAITYVLLGNGHYEAEALVSSKELEEVFKPDGTRGHDPSDGPDDDDDDDDATDKPD